MVEKDLLECENPLSALDTAHREVRFKGTFFRLETERHQASLHPLRRFGKRADLPPKPDPDHARRFDRGKGAATRRFDTDGGRLRGYPGKRRLYLFDQLGRDIPEEFEREMNPFRPHPSNLGIAFPSLLDERLDLSADSLGQIDCNKAADG